jgi:RNA 2',3'-cyclic 3'-phosphodiesterase
MKAVRTFICIKLPYPILDQFSLLQKELRQFGQSVRWVHREGLHLTMKFLGDVEQNQMESVSKSVMDSVQGLQLFHLKFSGFGAFPNFEHPRIYWVGIHEPPCTLFDLYQRIEDNLHQAGFSREVRKFTPHMTLGRVKNTEGLDGISQFLSNKKFETVEFVVDKVLIMKSDLQPSGAEYTPLYSMQIGQKFED